MTGKRRFLRMVPLFLILYIVLHESGHCIVAMACGAKITEFNISSASVSYTGGDFNDTKSMMLHANGVLFPLIVSYLNMLIYPRSNRSSRYKVFSFGFSAACICCLSAWVFIPLLYVTGKAPENEDAAKFLEISSKYTSPFTVTALAVMLILLGVVLMIKKDIVKNFKEIKNTSA